MNHRILSFAAASLAAAVLGHAEPTDAVKAAAQKLADAANYGWTSTTSGGNFASTATGAAEKGGFAVITRSTQNGPVKIVAKGVQRVIESGDGWKTPDEMRAQGGGGGGGGGRGLRGALTAAVPAEEIGTLLSGVASLTEADGVISGPLSAEGAGRLLSFGRGGGGGAGGTPAPRNAAGAVKFWIKDGIVAKYEVHVTGTVSGQNGDLEVDRTTTTEINGLGSTKVEVPEAAKTKLEA